MFLSEHKHVCLYAREHVFLCERVSMCEHVCVSVCTCVCWQLGDRRVAREKWGTQVPPREANLSRKEGRQEQQERAKGV